MSKFMFLLTEHGRYQELKYASCVARKIADKIKAMGHDVVIIEKPSPSDANRAIQQYKPDVVWWVGHGNPFATTLENVMLWIQAPYGSKKEFNTDILNNIVACALSCYTGSYLGKYLTDNKGCISYLGYTKEFWFVWCNDPIYYNCSCIGKNPYGVSEELWVKIVTCPHESNLYFVLGLAIGMNTEQARNYSLRRFDYWINYFEKVKPKNQTELSILRAIIWVLNWDRKATVLHGRKDYVFKYVTKSKVAYFIPVMLLTVGSICCLKAGGE